MNNIDLEITSDLARFYADASGFCDYAFDWDRGGLKGFRGIDTWQRQYLDDVSAAVKSRGFDGVHPVMPIRFSVASGRGIGKSALTSMLILWLMSTRPRCKLTISANTSGQLKTKTFGELAKWRDLCITAPWFEMNTSQGNLSIYHRDFSQTWRADGITCRPENAGAFAGQHAANTTNGYIFDEAAEIPDILWEIALSGLTDGEPHFHAFGNPTRTTGQFINTLSSSQWNSRSIDSRTVAMTNKEMLKQEIDTLGIDHDRVRVHILGRPPNASDMQYFPSDIVAEAMRRPLPHQVGDEPLICGIDLSRGGNDNSIIQFRRGRDARSEKRYRISGEKTRDSMQLSALIATVLDRHQPDMTFLDMGSMGGPIGDRLRQLGYTAIDVGFGHKAQNEKLYPNRTSEMAARLLEWLNAGGCLPNVPELEQDLIGREFTHDSKDRLAMEKKSEMKRRLGRSPDDSDALFLTFASTVCRRLNAPRDDRPLGVRGQSEAYHPFDRLSEVVG